MYMHRSFWAAPHSPAPTAGSLGRPVTLQSNPGLGAKEISPWSKPGEGFAGRGGPSALGHHWPPGTDRHRQWLCSPPRARAAGADLLRHAPRPLCIIKAFRPAPALAYAAHYVCSASVSPPLSGRQRNSAGSVAGCILVQQWKPFSVASSHPSSGCNPKSCFGANLPGPFRGGGESTLGSEPCPCPPQPLRGLCTPGAGRQQRKALCNRSPGPGLTFKR